MFIRALQSQLESRLFKGRIVVLYGARQVGKTTLVKKILQPFLPQDGAYFNADEADIRHELIQRNTSTALHNFLGSKRLIVIDEAQRIPNIGLKLKLLIDQYPNQQILVTGSSSFELANQIIEPLTGRKYELFLPPLAFTETIPPTETLYWQRSLNDRIIWGGYPDVVTADPTDRALILREIANSYLYKDILTLETIKHPVVLSQLLKLLALQLGSTVSITELAQNTGVDKKTILRYLDLLEKAFIIFPLQPLSNNPRREIKKHRKYYFWDTGIRNAIINNFNPLDLRMDKGGLFENFVLAERYKYLKNNLVWVNQYFWRSHTQQEVDYIEEAAGQHWGYEIKWNPQRRSRFPKLFQETYGDNNLIIHPENLWEFLTNSGK